MNDEVTEIMGRVEARRAEIRTIKQQIREEVAAAMQLSGVGGMWAKLTGKYEQQVEEAEKVVLTLRADLADKQRRLEVAERELASARERAKRAQEPTTEPRGDTASPAAPVSAAPTAAGQAVPGDALGQLEKLEEVLRQLRRTADRIEERAALAGPTFDPMKHSVSSGRGGARSLQKTARALVSKPSTDLGSVGIRWEGLVEDAEVLADHLGLLLALPRMASTDGGIGRSHAVTAHPGSAPARGGMRTSDVSTFAGFVKACVPSIDDLIDDVIAARDAASRGDEGGMRAALASSRGGASGGAAGDARAQLASQWDTLFGIAKILDREAKPGARTADLLGPMSRWNQQATATRAYAEAHGLNPIPPINQGGDLLGFVDGLRAMLPMLEEQVDDLRS